MISDDANTVITLGDIVSVTDGLDDIESLDEITRFGLYELMDHHRQPDMILRIIELAIREKDRVMEELRQDLDGLRDRLQSARQ